MKLVRITFIGVFVGLGALASAGVQGSGAGDVMRGVIEQYQADYRTVDRLFDVRFSPLRHSMLHKVLDGWKARLDGMEFSKLDYEDQIDYVLLKHHVKYADVGLSREEKDWTGIASLMTFSGPLVDLIEAKESAKPVDPKKAADTVSEAAAAVRKLQASLTGGGRPNANVSMRASQAVGNLQRGLADWYGFYKGYDPLFAWWADSPYAELSSALQEYSSFLGGPGGGARGGVGAGGVGRRGGAQGGPGGAAAGAAAGGAPQRPAPTQASAPITGIPVGRDALMEELDREMIPYTPEELISVAEQELAWCESEIKKASREMGFGDDWKKALEKVKNSYVQPGDQPQLIEKLATEAIGFVRAKNLVTVPALAGGTWRIEMMTPERQLVNPFFTGGETISVSFPTDTMTEDQKMMSMRGNNIYFSRATVFHELIPGHYLQEFMNARYRPYRGLFGTPFWIEGGALYWEMLFYDVGFPTTPEQKIGMLFWRMHRCARVMFSLKFHMGQMTPQQCVDFLVDRIGHERANAEGEVRRSFAGGYSTLYQAAYLIGGLQIRALHKELVDSGKMTNLEFNDAILHEGNMPIEMVRVALTHPALSKEYDPVKDPAHLKLGL